MLKPTDHNVICPYCFEESDYVDSSVIYGRSYGMIYLCVQCDAYVGVHSGTDNPLGRLANKELREWKKKAHDAFDPIWQNKVNNGEKQATAREGAYVWLANKMGIERDYVHIGMFDVDQCKRVIQLCTDYEAPQPKTNWERYAFNKNRRYSLS